MDGWDTEMRRDRYIFNDRIDGDELETVCNTSKKKDSRIGVRKVRIKMKPRWQS